MPMPGPVGALASQPCFHRARTGCIDSLQRRYPRCDSIGPLTAEQHYQGGGVRIARGRMAIGVIDAIANADARCLLSSLGMQAAVVAVTC
jgi:hypothetical protein